MYHVTPEIYGKLASEIERVVEWVECASFYDYDDPDGIKDTVEVETEDGKFFIVLDFYAMPGYRYEEINPGLYAPYDSQFGYTRTSLSVDCRKFTVTDEDDTVLEHVFSEKELVTYLN